MAGNAATHGIGWTVKQVEIRELDPVRFIARCVDTEGQMLDVATSIHRTGFQPEVGQIWIVDRDMGAWTFRGLLDISTGGPWPVPPVIPQASPWTSLTLQNGWAASVNPDDPPPEVRVGAYGTIEVCGVITGGTVPAVGVSLAVAVLPAGLPAFYTGNAVLATNRPPGGPVAALRASLTAAGVVNITPWETYAPTWIDLSGLWARVR